ncbi:substrate-binding domain-containing protein [Pararhodobacter sp.]|uniref:substrate-binding domain-containing protein n=1 Tax=Pararhodobacter sp. TaxID=2127056 RepID=UPI002FDD7BD5
MPNALIRASRRLLCGLSVIAAMLASSVTAAGARELLVLTSYDTDVVTPLVAAFVSAHPDVSVRVLNKNTNAAVDELLGGNERHFDLFWASAPEAFEVLAQAGRLADLGQGLHTDFAYSAVGWTWRAPFNGTPPQDWNDLLDPALAGRVGMSHPMRSGTTHSLIETILQDRGWDAGWAWLLQLAGQLNTISARSFGVLEGVERGSFTLGLTIDFLALTRADRGLVFRYGRPLIIIPARIAGLQGGRNPETAQQFVEFLLGPEGQNLLLTPEIRRIPVDAGIRAELADSFRPEVRAALQFSWSRYDPVLASRRYWEVKELFEAFIGRDFLRRRDLWRRWHALSGQRGPELARLRAILTRMPVSEFQARTAPRDRATLLAWAALSHALLDRAEAGLAALEARQ